MLIRSTDTLHYPITVTKLLVQPSAQVQRFDILFKYTYKSKVTEGNKYGDEEEVEKTFPAEFKSETDGEVISWQIKPGDILTGPRISIVTIEEPCTHEETFGNLCVNCGKDVTKLDNYLTSVPNAARATVNTSHTNTALKQSQRLANKNSEEATRRLLEQRKLSLVVDLDQTIIHATVEPTVAEWQKDPTNANYNAVKDVREFQLVDDGPGMRGCSYYIKLRPGLEEFLEAMAKKYELHIYTMGTRAYAQNIAKIVDPQQKVFGDRILSRDESGSLTVKSLQRLFPVNTDMVVIIDDRGDVWNWSPNLVKVTAYDFFVGIGDINGSFLPPKETVAKSKPKLKPKTATNGTNGSNKVDAAASDDANNGEDEVAPTALEAQLVAMAGSDNEATIEEQKTAQEETIAAQLEDRPLLKKQEMLDKMDDSDEANGELHETPSETSQKHHRHNLLHDDDEELRYLQMNLENVHQQFFEEYDKRKIIAAGDRVAELRGEKTSPKKAPVIDDLVLAPDVKIIMPQMKEEVLKDVVICFTGVIPQGIDHNKSDIGLWARSFGARINPNLTKSTTHVIAHRERRTTKVRQAAQHPQISIVMIGWLLECFTRWIHADERPHLIEFERESGGHDSLPFDDLERGLRLTPSEEGEALDDLPEDFTEDLQSPTSFEGGKIDWDEMDDEFADFMGSDAESEFDDGTESDASNASEKSGSTTASSGKRRKRKIEDVDGGGEGASELQKRKRRALERSTGLRDVTTIAAEQSSGLPSPETTGPEEEEGDKIGGGDVDGLDEEEGEEDDGDDDFTKEFMEAMEGGSDDEEEVDHEDES